MCDGLFSMNIAIINGICHFSKSCLNITETFQNVQCKLIKPEIFLSSLQNL